MASLWREVPLSGDAIPARGGHAAAVLGATGVGPLRGVPVVALVGGADAFGLCSSDVFFVNPDSGKTQKVACGAAPAARCGHTLTATCATDAILIHGQEPLSDKTFGDVWRLRAALSDDGGAHTAAWERQDCAGDEPCARHAHAAAALSDGRVVVVGGSSGGNAQCAGDEVFVLSTKTFVWQRLACAPPGSLLPREMHAVCCLSDGNTVVVGGGRSASGDMVAKAAVLAISGGTVTVSAAPGIDRVCHSLLPRPGAVGVDGVLVTGGVSASTHNMPVDLAIAGEAAEPVPRSVVKEKETAEHEALQLGIGQSAAIGSTRQFLAAGLFPGATAQKQRLYERIVPVPEATAPKGPAVAELDE